MINNIMRKKKYILAVAFTFFILCFCAFFISEKHLSFFGGKIALAENDEGEDDFYEKDNEYINDNQENNIPVAPDKINEATPEKISDTIFETSTTTIQRLDSDGDGIFDDEDKYPEINDYIIVNDNNLNGIVDKYERQ
jgi:hypothetical protein